MANIISFRVLGNVLSMGFQKCLMFGTFKLKKNVEPWSNGKVLNISIANYNEAMFRLTYNQWPMLEEGLK